MSQIDQNIQKFFKEINSAIRQTIKRYENNEVAKLDEVENKVVALATELNKLDKDAAAIYQEQLQTISSDMKKVRDLISNQMTDIKTEIDNVTKRQKAEDSYSKAANDN